MELALLIKLVLLEQLIVEEVVELELLQIQVEHHMDLVEQVVQVLLLQEHQDWVFSLQHVVHVHQLDQSME